MNTLACYLCPHCECNHWRSRTVVQKHFARVRVTLISLCTVWIVWAALAAVLTREIQDQPRKFVQLHVIFYALSFFARALQLHSVAVAHLSS